jgi:protein Mpv17
LTLAVNGTSIAICTRSILELWFTSLAIMRSAVINSTIQAASLAGLSNLLAQVIQAYRADKPVSLDYVTLLQFVVFSLLATPPNVLWLEYMEEKFPADVVDGKGNKKLHKGNTAVKFVLDQTLGAIVNGYLFIAGIGALKGKDSSTIWADVHRVSYPRNDLYC